MTFSKFDDHSSPLFKSLRIVKLFDLVSIETAIFMYKFQHSFLPSVFDSFLLMLIKFINIIHDLLLINHTTFPELELIIAFSISNSRGPQYGVL